ncbi:MAG: lactoylglutathione lyase [Sphingomicrobium sp.]
MHEPRQIFVNLPVRDFAVSRRFMEALGASNVPAFSDDTGACMTFSDSIFFMLLSHDKYRQFTPLPIADATKASGALFALSCASRVFVDEVIEAGVAAGGTADPSPVQDHGFMYGRSLLDPDGNHFEVFWLDAAAATQSGNAAENE